MTTIGTTSRPAYVYDAQSDTWVPIGFGPHSHDNYIDKNAIAAKGDLVVGTANDTAGILTVGTNGQYLVADDTTATGLDWVDVDALPDQTDNEGKYLSTDGTTASWVEVDALPDQTDNEGKYLTTDGTDASWVDVDALPDQSGQTGNYLTTDGSTASWAPVESGGDPTPQIFLMMGA